MKHSSRLTSLVGSQRGNATVEFGILALFFFGIVMVALDFGIYAQQRLKLGDAVEQGAVLAFNTSSALNTTTIANYIKTTAGLASTPQITCNNGSTCASTASRGSSDYRCIDQTTGAISSTNYAVGAACAGGGNAGYYLKIVASRTYNSIAVPDKYLNGGTMSQTVIVRLQ